MFLNYPTMSLSPCVLGLILRRPLFSDLYRLPPAAATFRESIQRVWGRKAVPQWASQLLGSRPKAPFEGTCLTTCTDQPLPRLGAGACPWILSESGLYWTDWWDADSVLGVQGGDVSLRVGRSWSANPSSPAAPNETAWQQWWRRTGSGSGRWGRGSSEVAPSWRRRCFACGEVSFCSAVRMLTYQCDVYSGRRWGDRWSGADGGVESTSCLTLVLSESLDRWWCCDR